MTKTLILGIGGAGCNMAEAVKRNATAHHLTECAHLFADSDIKRLSEFDGKGFETLTLQRDSDTFPKDILKDVNNLYIIVGLGGTTGSKFAEIAAKSANSTGVANVSLIVTLPFGFEGAKKMDSALKALDSLSELQITVLKNEDLINRYPDLNFINAFEYSDNEVVKAMVSADE